MMKKVATLVSLIVVFNLFFFPLRLPSFGRLDSFVLLVLAQAVLWFIYWPKKWQVKEKIGSLTTCLALVAGTFSLMAASWIDRFLLGATSFFLTLFTAYTLLLDTAQFGGLAEICLAPLKLFGAWLLQASRQYLHPKELQQAQVIHEAHAKLKKYVPSQQIFMNIIRGVIVTVPIALVLVFLLSHADPIFSNLLSKVFSFKLPTELVPRIWYSLLLTLLLIPSLNLIVSHAATPTQPKQWQSFWVEATMVTSVVALILGGFLLVQFRYLFATVPENQLHTFGINTYSEYVRKGFIELLLVTAISYTVCGVSYLVSRAAKELKKPSVLIGVSYALLAELILFIASILRRVYLYQAEHGLTRIRIYGLAFVIYLLGLVVCMAGRYRFGTKKAWYLFEVGFAVVVILATAFLKPDHFIATQAPPTVNNEVDYVYISRLSADALPGWIKAYGYAQETLKKAPPAANVSANDVRQLLYAAEISKQLKLNYALLVLRYGSLEDYKQLYEFKSEDDAKGLFVWYGQRGWQKLNLSERQSYEILRKTISPNDLRQLEADLDRYIQQVAPEQIPNQLDRSYNTPLL